MNEERKATEERRTQEERFMAEERRNTEERRITDEGRMTEVRRRRTINPPMSIEPVREEPVIDISSVDLKNEDATYWKRVAFEVYNNLKNWKQRYLQEHQINISQKLMYEELSNEIKGFLRKRSVEVSKLVVEDVLSVFAAHKDIQEVVKEVRPSSWFKFTKWIALTLVLGLFIFFAATNENFAKLLNDNAMFIVIGAIVIVGLYLYFDRKSGKK